MDVPPWINNFKELIDANSSYHPLENLRTCNYIGLKAEDENLNVKSDREARDDQWNAYAFHLGFNPPVNTFIDISEYFSPFKGDDYCIDMEGSEGYDCHVNGSVLSLEMDAIGAYCCQYVIIGLVSVDDMNHVLQQMRNMVYDDAEDYDGDEDEEDALSNLEDYLTMGEKFDINGRQYQIVMFYDED